MNERTRRALIRLGRMLAMAVLPVLISSLQAEEFNLTATAVATAIAALAALDKYLRFKPEPSAE